MPTQDDRPLPADTITDELRDLAGRLTTRLDGAARVDRERTEDTGAVEGATVTPSRAGAVGVHWTHSADDIIVGLGSAPGWEMPRTAEGVRTLQGIVEAAVRGDVEVGKARGVTTYRVRTDDGKTLEDTHEGLAGFVLSMPWKPRLRWAQAKPYASVQ